jgi:hypothetical protein
MDGTRDGSELIVIEGSGAAPDQYIMPPENRIHIGDLGPGDIALLKQVAQSAADEAVQKWLVAMGLDPNDPIGTQGIFSALRDITKEHATDEAKADRLWTRRTRVRSEGLIGKALLTAIGIAVYGAATDLWSGFMALMKSH